MVAINRLTDLALPGTNGALRFTDRDALLVRSDLRAPKFHLFNIHARIFKAMFDFQGLVVFQGWISADVHVRNRHFRLVVTHLESPVPGVPEATAVQVAQAKELIHALRNLRVPVVLCGDFNSDANLGSGIDATPSAALIEAAGYADTWRIANPNDPGATWPLFLEDRPSPDFFALFSPFERIDLFFSRGMQVIGAMQVLAPAPLAICRPMAPTMQASSRRSDWGRINWLLSIWHESNQKSKGDKSIFFLIIRLEERKGICPLFYLRADSFISYFNLVLYRNC